MFWIIPLATIFSPVFLSLAIKALTYISTQSYVYENAQDIPKNKVGLVLGTSRYLANGRENLFFSFRMKAAKELFEASKISYLLVSGANPSKYYDEPKEMKKVLVSMGVPANKIYCDYAGLRTLDSIIRAKEVFQLEEFTIISQDFHNRRALFIAHHHNIQAIAFNAQEVPLSLATPTMFREELARIKMVLDLFIIRKAPRHLGDPIPIHSP